MPVEIAVAPLVKTVTVACSIDRAFTLFTSRIADWWPLSTHSVGETAAESLAIEGHVGGRIVETLTDGSEHVWGTLTAWSPPRRLAFSWHPGRPATDATHVEVTFATAGQATGLTLVHTGWESVAEGAVRRRGYDTGWDGVLSTLVASSRGADPVRGC
jgi:uncharacterized protein YndB with AHSA1/START domain